MPTVIAGQRITEYVLDERIGVGAFSEVWCGHHHMWTDQLVAVKIPTHLDFIRNIQKDAVVHGLRHAAIVRVTGMDPYHDPPYLIMEYVPGTNLRPLIRARKLTARDAVTILRQILGGLAEAHSKGIVHRDIKPENILIHERATAEGYAAEGAVKVVDFGLGKAAAAGEISMAYSTDQSEDGRIIGTLDYMAPEQRRGEDVDARADLYSCGVLLFEMLTGEMPEGHRVPSKRNPSVPTYLDEVFVKAYAARDERFASAEDFSTALTPSKRSRLSAMKTVFMKVLAPPRMASEPEVGVRCKLVKAKAPIATATCEATADSAEQRRLIEETIRGTLRLPANANLGPNARSRVKTLSFYRTALSDTGLALLANASAGLSNLRSLSILMTQSTSDTGVKALACPDTCLKALEKLNLGYTNLSDAGIKELASSDTGIKALTTLELAGTVVSDEGMKELARPETGLGALKILDLRSTRLTDAGLKELARSDTGLKALTTLLLAYTKLTDAGLKELARSSTGLKALATLDLGHNRRVTDAGIKALARRGSSLQALAVLDLSYTRLTDDALSELGHPETGLKALAKLNLYGTEITDAGMKDLAHPDSGLRMLSCLQLGATKVSAAGVRELARPDGGLSSLTRLELWHMRDGDAYLKELARSDAGLRALTSIVLYWTPVTDAAVEMLQKARPQVVVLR